MPKDKLNRVDFHWFVVRTQPGHENELCAVVRRNKDKVSNILEAYCPTHTTVNVQIAGRSCRLPLFDGYVFVLATQNALADFIRDYYPRAVLMFNRKQSAESRATLCTIPEAQMRMFKDFNENYPDTAIPLERPYTDYAFNPKTNEPNDIVKVIDGPLAGTEGYITKFRRDKRLVYHLKGLDMAVSIPNIWNFHVVRVHNAEGDRQTLGTIKERAVDLLIGLIQGCGYGDKTLPMLYEFVDELTFKPSLVDFCKSLYNKGHKDLSQRFAKLDTKNAEWKAVEEQKKAEVEAARIAAEQAEAQRKAEEEAKRAAEAAAQQAAQQAQSVQYYSNNCSSGSTSSTSSGANTGTHVPSTAQSSDSVYYQNCDAVRAAGKAPLYRGQPGYSAKLDRDKDGVACE